MYGPKRGKTYIIPTCPDTNYIQSNKQGVNMLYLNYEAFWELFLAKQQAFWQATYIRIDNCGFLF